MSAPPMRLLDAAVEISRAAGLEVMRVYREQHPEVATKADQSPLTAADLASQRLIESRLAELTPEVPLLAEESAATPAEERRRWKRYWLVDPLDGTKEFLRRNDEFTVNLALVDSGRPLLGVVHAPALRRSYAGVVGEGAWRTDGEGAGRRLRAQGSESAEFRVVASRSHPGPALEAFLEALPAHRLVPMGSSLKICLVAEGAADLYPRLGPTMEWDTAAAHAVLAAAGGRLVDVEGADLVYNKPDLHNPWFLALGERAVPWREAAAACR